MPRWSMAPEGQFSDWASAQVWRTNTVYGWQYKYCINNNRRNVVYKCKAHLECFAELNLHLVKEDSCVYIRNRGITDLPEPCPTFSALSLANHSAGALSARIVVEAPGAA